MNRQTQWLFEAPPDPVTSRYSNFEYGSEYLENSNLEALWELEAVVLRSDRFRNDSRLQAAANNRPPIRQGERGRAVQTLQQALIDLSFPMPISTRRYGTPDGIYGAETAATVRRFQLKYGLTVDGVVGRNTMSRLDQLFQRRPKRPPGFIPVAVIPQTMVAFASGYPNPHSSLASELQALNRGVWEPSNPDFAAIAASSSATAQQGIDGLPSLLDWVKQQNPGSIQKLILVGHSNKTAFSFSGKISVSKNKPVVTFDSPQFAIQKSTLAAAQPTITKNQLWNRFTPGAEIILVGCNIAAGMNSSDPCSMELLEALSNAFKVCVRGFKRRICVFLSHKGIRGRTGYDVKGKLSCNDLTKQPKLHLNLDQISALADSGLCCAGVGAPLLTI